MIRRRRGRRRALAAAALLLAVPAAVLGAEVLAAASRQYADPASAPPQDARFGDPAAPGLTLAVLGDSTGAGLGVRATGETVGGRIAAALAAGGGHAVTLRGFAVSGARAADLAGQVDRLAAARLPGPVVAVVLVGANDATHVTRLAAVGREVAADVRRLRALGVAVVVGTCPDLGAARAFGQPLRLVAAWRGRAVADAEAAAALAAGGVPVPLGRLTGPAFRRDPATLSGDLFHPSATGYALWAEALLPAVRAAAATAGARP